MELSGLRICIFPDSDVPALGILTRSPMTYCDCWPLRMPLYSRIEYKNGTNFDERANWLSEGCQPEVNTSNEPFPTGTSNHAGSPLSKAANFRAFGIFSRSMLRYFQKCILVKLKNRE